MSDYQPRADDMAFILTQVVRAPEQLQALAPFAEVDADLMIEVLGQSARFVGEVIAPLNRIGDEVGAQYQRVQTPQGEDGRVTMPPGFRDAYQAFWQAGWPALACAPEDGGQGLPTALEAMLYEMLSAANHGWTMAPGLLHGAYECIKHHASEDLRKQYLEKVATGEWLATMCLTEPHAGSDLGLARTRATPQSDGSYQLNGTKIFISGGEHDLSDNIVHLVLARLPDAPPGPRGLSLFLVPKFYADGRRSAAICDRIEEKMGLHGSPTCVMRFDDAQGWLIGETGRGLNAMFVMMNAARLHVAMQGLGLLDSAWQKADAYAQERRQMRAPKSAGAATSHAPDLIALHPAMRRILDTQRGWVDAGRVLAYTTAVELDLAKHHPLAARRAAAQSWCALVTPVLKACLTHQAFHGGSDCLQVFGGHGYVREWGVEQVLRDARVAMIYEGTNEIQAIDLLVRKVLADGGASLATLLQSVLQEQPVSAAWQDSVAQRFAQVQEVTTRIAQASQHEAALPYWVADDYLRLLAIALLGWAAGRIDAAVDAVQSAGSQAQRWQAPVQALQCWVLPEFEMRLDIIRRRVEAASVAAPVEGSVAGPEASVAGAGAGISADGNAVAKASAAQ